MTLVAVQDLYNQGKFRQAMDAVWGEVNEERGKDDPEIGKLKMIRAWCHWRLQEWDDAKWDVIWHRAWKHSFPVNRGPPDLTPAISSRYPDGETVTTVGLCAPKEHEMRQEADVSFCCSRRFRKGWFGENTKICA